MSANQFQRAVLLTTFCFAALISSGLFAQEDSAEKLTAERMFAAHRVTDIKIELAEADWDKIRFQSRSFSEALTKKLPEKIFEYVKGNVTIDGILIENVGIRKKGFIGSLSTERPSLKIKFGEYIKQSPISGLDRLTLNNNKQDAGRICQYLAYKLYRESGTHAPRCGFASVTVNGKHLGVYSNVEAIKPNFLEHSFGNKSGALYEGTVTDFFQEYVEKFEAKNKRAKFDDIQNVVDALAADKMDEKQLAELERFVDVESFIKFWAMESLIGFWDGYCSNQNNYYLYHDAASDKFHFIPWGTDSAFTETSPLPPYLIRPRSVHGKAVLPNKLYRNDAIKAKYKTTLMSFLDEHWDEEKLGVEIDRLEALLRDYVLEDNQEFQEVLDQFRRFINSRRKAITGEYQKQLPKLAAKNQKPVYFSAIGTIKASFSTTWFDQEPTKAPEEQSVDVSMTINGKEVIIEDAIVYATTDKFNKDNASVVIKGKSKATGKEIIIGAGLPKSEFLVPSTESRNAAGVVLQPGILGMLNPKMKMMFGAIEIEKSSTEKGEPVKGKLNMAIGEFRGLGE